MQIVKSSLPCKSLLRKEEEFYDYSDSFQGNFIDRNGTVTSTKVGQAFFMSGPKWIDILFALRNKLVEPLGLKTAGKIKKREQLLENFTCDQGDQLGLFKVFNKTDNEVILGEDDKHLNFRVSLFIDQHNDEEANKKLIISTTIKFNNWFGRLYFLPLRPFHKLIVVAMLKKIIQRIEN